MTWRKLYDVFPQPYVYIILRFTEKVKHLTFFFYGKNGFKIVWIIHCLF